jgi:hypothetical protein
MEQGSQEGSQPQITEVKLKNGKFMKHLKSKDGKHLFFNNIIAVNVWMAAVLVFILLTTIMMSYSVALQVQQAGNMILQEIRELRTDLALCYPNDFNLTVSDSIHLSEWPPN